MMKQINQFNFLRWHTSEEFIPTNYDPAKGYMRDSTRCPYMPLLINGEPLIFYINTLSGLDDIIDSEPLTSDLEISTTGNLSANHWYFLLNGTPAEGDAVHVTIRIDDEDAKTASVEIGAEAGWDLDDLINALLDVFNTFPFCTTSIYAIGEEKGLMIVGDTEATGTVNLEKAENPNVTTLKLVNAQTGQVVNADIATLIQDSFVDGDGNNVFTYYASVSPSSIAPGVYFFRIGNATDNFLDSNNVLVPADTNYRRYSCLCKFRHDRYYYGVNYQNLDDFYQQFRLHLNEIDGQYENDRDVYNEVTTGRQRTYNNFKKKLRTLEAYYFDADAHDAAEIMFDSEELFVNGRQYTKKATYKILNNPAAKLNKGVIDLYDQDFATANRCLTPIAAAGGDCAVVELPEITLPEGTFGTPYSYSVELTGDQPFQLSDVTKPAWMAIGILGTTLSFTGTPDVTGGDIEVSFTISNCSDNGTANFAGTVDVVYDDGYNITYTNNLSIDIVVHYGNNAESPSHILVDETYPGGNGIEGTSVNLPLTNGIVVLDISGTGKHIVSATCNGAVGSFTPHISTTATWTGVNGGVHISFITD